MSVMKRLTATCLSFLVSALPNTLYALGLGELTLRSHLNEPLQARIALEDIQSIALEDLIPKVAEPVSYAKEGLVPPAWLYTIDFKVMKRENGGYYLSMSTQRPIVDPFVDLLIEVAWPNGKIIREYTLLFDLGHTASNPPVTTTAVYKKVKRDKTSQNNLGASHKPMHFAKSEQVVPGMHYGPIHEQTLWGIARRLVNNTDLTIYQGVVAIAKKNPHAFKQGNIHNLIQGVDLELPTLQEIRQYSKQAARDLVQTQGAVLSNTILENAQNRPLAESEYHEVNDAVRSKRSTPLKLLIPEEESLNSNEPVTTQKAAEKVSMLQRLTVIEEALDTLKHANEAISKENKHLQTQNASLSTLLMAKEKEIADLQASIKQKNTVFTRNKVQKVSTKAPSSVVPQQAKPASVTSIQKQSAAAAHPQELQPQKKDKVAFVLTILLAIVFSGLFWINRRMILSYTKRFAKKRHAVLSQLKMKWQAIKIKPVEKREQVEPVAPHFQFDVESAMGILQEQEKMQHRSKMQLKEVVENEETLTVDTLLKEVDACVAYEKYQEAEKILQRILAHHPQEWVAVLKLLELYVLTQRYIEFSKKYQAIAPFSKEISSVVWSKLNALKEHVQHEKAISLQPFDSQATDARQEDRDSNA